MSEDSDIKSAKAYGREIQSVASDEDTDYLGRIIWYTFGEMLVPRDDLVKQFHELGIPEKYLPPEVQQKGAWKRACKKLEHKEEEVIEDVGEKLVTEYMTRKVDADTRIIVKEVRRTDKGQLDYKKLVRFEFNSEDDIKFEPLDASFDVASDWYDRMLDRYEILRESYEARHIRNNVRNTINKLNPVSMRQSGGVYFVPEKHADLIEKLATLTRYLGEEYGQSSYRTELIQLEVISKPDKKEMIARKIKQDTVGKANDVMQNFKQIINEDRDIYPSEFEDYNDQIKELMERKEEYEEMLGRQLGTCEEQIEIMKKQLGRISDHIKAED